MDRILPPDPTKPTVIYQVVAPRIAAPYRVRGRSVFAGVCALAAAYLAFAVGTPWLLRDAPPDTYALVATRAACGTAADWTSACAPAHP